jgi:hypothetical protein
MAETFWLVSPNIMNANTWSVGSDRRPTRGREVPDILADRVKKMFAPKRREVADLAMHSGAPEWPRSWKVLSPMWSPASDGHDI